MSDTTTPTSGEAMGVAPLVIAVDGEGGGAGGRARCERETGERETEEWGWRWLLGGAAGLEVGGRVARSMASSRDGGGRCGSGAAGLCSATHSVEDGDRGAQLVNDQVEGSDHRLTRRQLLTYENLFLRSLLKQAVIEMLYSYTFII